MNQNNFLIQVPRLSPSSKDYPLFWEQQLKYCIEGYWAGGYYMPPALYFYVNFSTIRLNKKRAHAKVYDRPMLRDVEWMLFRALLVTRGFSGFLEDPHISCNKALLEDYPLSYYQEEYPSTITSQGTLKTYEDPISYLSRSHPSHYPTPLYENEAKNFMLMGARNWGKDLHHSTLLHYEDKTRPISQVSIGDKIYDPSGNLTTVTNVFKFTDQLQYELTLLDGRKIKAGAGHKWFVKKKLRHSTTTQVVTTAEIISDFRNSSRKDYNYFLPTSNPVAFSTKDLPIDPYFLGALLGDGCITQRVTFTTADEEILSYFNTSDTITKLKSKYVYYIKGNDTYQKLKALQLLGTNSSTKFIPSLYLRSSIEQRMSLLQGLMDTDGYISKDGCLEYSTNSLQLAEDMIFLLRSLGIRANEPKLKNKSYRIKIGTDKPIFRLKRKLERLKTYKKSSFINWVPIVSITPTQIEDSYCISVDNDSHLFLANSFIPTHNSYSIGAGLVTHTFLFDNRTSFFTKPSPTEILVGSVVSDKSADLLKKAKDAMDFLPGGYATSTTKIPAPFAKRYTGSFAVNSEIVAQYKQGKDFKGSRSSIKHRSFNENSFAAQGTRPSILVLEECGLIPNLIDIHSNTVDNLRDGLRKTGSLIMLGTGGDMEKGTVPSSQMFFEPDKYDILKFVNVYEETQVPIGFFLPAYYSLNEFKDSQGNTDVEAAKKALLDKRELLKKGSSDALYKEIQYKPLTPSEMFLDKAANIFPAAELRAHLTSLMNNPPASFNASLFFDPTSKYNGVNYEIDTFSTPLDTYPYSSDNREGAITIYELPTLQNDVPLEGGYIIGHDPIKEDTPTGPSLAVIYVMKTNAYFSTNSHSEIVAVYRGRPYEGKNAINAILHKLSLFYGNAKIYYEAQVGNVKDYFERIGRLDLLCATPTTIFQKKAAFNNSLPTTYGYPMSNDRIKWEAIQYTRNFLLETHHDTFLNLHLIPDKALVQELISFNMNGNFDSVMTLVGCVVGLQELHNTSIRRTFNLESRKGIYQEFNKINSRLFPNADKATSFF